MFKLTDDALSQMIALVEDEHHTIDVNKSFNIEHEINNYRNQLKNQNVLEQKHIDKIVETYEKRVDVDKFAHVAEMSEIVENGYNLNIPRYVDTFEEEEPVDLKEVRNRIQKLEIDTKAAIDKAESILKELGL